MREILGEIQSGDFAREWIAENRAGQENFQRMRAEQAATQVEAVGGELRSHMDWIKPDFELAGDTDARLPVLARPAGAVAPSRGLRASGGRVSPLAGRASPRRVHRVGVPARGRA